MVKEFYAATTADAIAPITAHPTGPTDIPPMVVKIISEIPQLLSPQKSQC